MMDALAGRNGWKKWFALCLGLGVAAVVQAAPSVVDTGPHDTQRQARQIWLRFSDDMVALGDDKAPDAATVTCDGIKEAPKGHWLDGRRWVAEFQQPLGDGVTCEIKPAALKTLKGESLAVAPAWRFDTGGPQATLQNQRGVMGWAKEEPVVALFSSAPLDSATLKYLRCSVNKRDTPVTVLSGLARQTALTRILGQHWIENPANPVLAVQCGIGYWPANADVQFLWDARIASAAHVHNKEDVPLSLKVRPLFAAQFSCSQMLATQGCDPRARNNNFLTLQFSESIPSGLVSGIELVDSKGQVIPGKAENWSGPVQTVAFHGDLSERSQLRLHLPDNLIDMDGRPLTNRDAVLQALQTVALPPYVGMAQSSGILPWVPGKSAAWPVATRGLEKEVPVAAWHFSARDSDDATLLRLIGANANNSARLEDLTARSGTPFASSKRVIDELAAYPGARIPAMQNKVLHPASQATAFSSLALEGYGMWLVEADSPAYRDLLARQYAALKKENQTGNAKTLLPLEWINSRYAIVQLTNLRAETYNSIAGDSLVWVTAVDSGEPVAGAQVDLWAWRSGTPVKLYSAASDAQGRVVVPAAIGWNQLREMGQNSGQSLMLVVHHGDDLLATGVNGAWQALDVPLMHTVADRVLLHPGETLSLQHLARIMTRQGYAVPALDGKWKLQIFQGYAYYNAKPVYEQSLTWSAVGSADSSWKIPATAKLGNYTYQLVHPGFENRNLMLGQGNFQVEEFRTPSFEAQFDSKPVWNGTVQTLEMHGALSYLAGGAAAGQEVSVGGTYSPGGHVDGLNYIFVSDTTPATPPLLATRKFKLDAKGHGVLRIPAPAFDRPLLLEAEMSFADPNGETKSEQTMLTVWPKRHKLGLLLDWTGQEEPIKAEVIALDENDKPLTGEAVTARLFDAKDRIVATCPLKTDAAGKADCRLGDKLRDMAGMRAEVTADGASGVSLKVLNHLRMYQAPGKGAPELLEITEKDPLIGKPLHVHVHSPFLPATLLLTVERQGVHRSLVRKIVAQDELIELPTTGEDAPSVTLRALVVPAAQARAVDGGKDWHGESRQVSHDVRFAESSGSLTLAVTPAQTTVLPGESVKVKLKASFTADGQPAAHARVTVAAVDDALLALRPNETWDLLRAYWHRAGTDVVFMASDESWLNGNVFATGINYFPPMELAVERQWVPQGMNADLSSPWDGYNAIAGRLPSPRMAMAAPAPITSMDYKAAEPMSGVLQRVQVTGSSISRADVEPHVKPRSNFSTLALWRTDVELDEHGEGSVTVPMPDTLTRWYIAAIGTAGPAHFGLGQANITTSQPVQILSGLPQSVRSDDVLVQKLTLRNTTEHPVTLTLKGSAGGQRDDRLPGARDPMPAASLATRGLQLERRLTLAPGENRVVEWQVAVPDGLTELDWNIAARDERGRTLDSLAVKQVVTAAVPVTVREASLYSLIQPQSISVAQPAGAKPGLGGVAVRWQNSLVEAAMEETRRTMARYPYSCMEQLSSKAVVSGDPGEWDKIMQRLPTMLDDKGLVRYFPETPGSEVLTAYLFDIADAYGLELPATEAERMRTGLRAALAREVSGSEAEWFNEQARLARRLALQATLAPDLGKVEPVVPKDLPGLPTVALVDWLRYVLKQPESAQRAAWLESASEQLRQRFDMQGTRMALRPNPHDDYWWFMWNGDMADARALLVIERNLKEQPRWQGLLPQLIAGLADRQREGHWRTTVANAWAGAALMEFAHQSELGPVTGTSLAKFGNAEAKATWPDAAPALLPWPQQGARGEVTLSHEGTGAPWATVQVLAAVNTPKPVGHGLSVQKTIEPLEQKIKGRWSVGDVLRVKLVMQSDAKLTWLAVRDPIPSGATIQGKGLKGETQLAHPNGWLWWWNPSSAELGNESYRGYYQFVWAGKWEADYVVRLNNAGTFTLPPTRIEAMYAPEIFGETPNAVMEVGP